VTSEVAKFSKLHIFILGMMDGRQQGIRQRGPAGDFIEGGGRLLGAMGTFEEGRKKTGN